MPRWSEPREYAPNERLPISWRITPALKEKIDKLTEASGRSMSATLEYLLERGAEAVLEVGGERATAFWRSLELEVTAFFGDDSWLADPARFDVVREHLIRRLKATTIIPPADGLADVVDTAINMAVDVVLSTGDPKFFQTARELAEKLPAERRAEVLAQLAEIEAEPGAHRARRISVEGKIT